VVATEMRGTPSLARATVAQQLASGGATGGLPVPPVRAHQGAGVVALPAQPQVEARGAGARLVFPEAFQAAVLAMTYRHNPGRSQRGQ